MRTSAPERDESSLLGGSLRGLTRFASRRSRLTLWIVAIVSVVALGLTIREMGFKTKRAELIGQKTDFHRHWSRYAESFGDESEIIVAVEANRSELVERALDDLGSRMDKDSEPFSSVVYRVDAVNLRGKGLQCYSPAELQSGLTRLQEYGPVTQGRWDLLKLDLLIDRLRNQIQTRSQSQSREAAKPLWRHAEMLTTSISANLDNSDDYRSPWPELLPGNRHVFAGSNRRVNALNDDRKVGYVRAMPTQGSIGWNGSSPSLSRLRALIAEISPDHPDVQIKITGIAALEGDEIRQSQFDLLLAAGIAFVGIGLLLLLAFRNYRPLLMATVVVVVALSWACAYATLVVGHFTILTISFACVLIGLGLDYAVHYLARYIELRQEGEDLRPALLQASMSRGPGILTSAITTALAFFAATFTEFLGIAELGLVAGGAILICALVTFVVLPPMILVSDRGGESRKISSAFEGAFVLRMVARYPRTVAIASLVLVIGISLPVIRYRDGRVEARIRYDQNAMNLQSESSESVEVQRQMFHETRDSLLFAVSIADSMDDARALRRKFEALPSVHHVDDLASRLPGQSAEQSRYLMQSYRSRLAGLPRSPARVANPDPARVGRSLEQLYLLARASSDPQAGKVERALDEFLDRFQEIPLQEQARFLSRYQQRVVGSMHVQLADIASASNPDPVRKSDVPASLLSRYRSSDGKWLLRIYPKEEIWEAEPLERFVADLRSVDPNVTGVPLQNHESERQIRSSCADASLYALAIIGIVLLVDFLRPVHKVVALVIPLAVIGFAIFTLHARRADINFVFLALTYVAMTAAIAAFLDFRQFRDALLAILVPLGGCGMMLGILALLRFDLNPVNMLVFPLLVGTSIDNGVHLLHDFRGQQAGKYRPSGSAVSAITISALTTLIGFGSLLIASHRGLRSVGMMMAIGTAGCLFVSLVVLPAILTMLSNRQESSGGTSRKSDSTESRQSSAATAKPPQRKAA